MNELTIPEYTVVDYDGDAPYEWLYQHKNNKFLLKRLTQKMAKQAGDLGVKGFIGLFNAYCESVSSKQGIQLDRQTDFEKAPMQLSSGNYVCNESGVFTLDKFGYEIPVCRHPIMPVRRLVNADSGEERLELWYQKGFYTRSIIVEKSVLASSSQILSLAAYGIMVNSDNAKLLSTYLQEIEQLNYQELPENVSIGRLGWIKNHGFSPYVGDQLVFDGETNYKHIFSAVSSHGDRETWMDAARKVRAERGPARLFLAASFASVILEPCGLLPFFLHAWGMTGGGKTVGLMLAASVWASPKLGEYVTTFDATGVGQEMMASFLNSLPMCIDELQIQSSAGIKDFDRMIYKLTEGVGRTRGAKTGGLQKQNTWKNCFITSGEHPISNANSGGGAVNRVIEFEVTENIYPDLVGLVAILTENYGFAGEEFIAYLQRDGMTEKVNELQKSIYRELLQTDSTDKQAASASALIAADRIATELFFRDGNELTVDDLAALMTKKEEVNQNARAYDYILDEVAMNPMHFKANEYGEYKSEIWGKEEETCVYIYPAMFDRLMRDGGYNAASFLSWARRKDLLIVDTDGTRTRNTRRIRFQGGRRWMICIRKQVGDNDESAAESPDDLELPF